MQMRREQNEICLSASCFYRPLTVPHTTCPGSILSCISSLPVSDPEGFLDSPQPLVDLYLLLYSKNVISNEEEVTTFHLDEMTERKADDETTSLLSIRFFSSHAALLGNSPEEPSCLVSIPTGGILQAAHSPISSYQRGENEKVCVCVCEYFSDFESP